MSCWSKESWRQRWKRGGRGDCGVAVGGIGSGAACRGDGVVKYRQRGHLVHRGAQGVRRRDIVRYVKTVWMQYRGTGCGHLITWR